MKDVNILPTHTPEEKKSVIVNVSHRLQYHGKVKLAYNRLFGAHLPHGCIERLFRMNSRVFTQEFNARVFRLLTENPNKFYLHDDYIQSHNKPYVGRWKDGTLLSRWEQYTVDPNPHHIIPESRGGTNNVRNLWRVDRITHNDFHTVFQNLTPIEQIVVLLNFYKEIFSGELMSLLRQLVLRDIAEPGCYKKGTITHKSRQGDWS